MTVAAQYRIRGRRASAIAASVEAAIRDGHLDAGVQLPPVRMLAARLAVSPATVASAYRSLRTRGLVSARRRAGTCVSARPPLPTRPAVPVPAHVRNLVDGNPDPALLPSLDAALRRLDRRARLYGERGADPALLEFAARQLASEGIPASALAVVGGALDGIERVLQAYLRPGDRVAVEDPGFASVFDLVNALGLVAEPVALDDFGPLPADLERVLHRGVEALILTPRAHNPTGAALDRRRASELRTVLARHPRVLVVEDDHAGPVAGVPAVTLATSDRQRWAVVRSVSKSLGPDLRLAVLAGDATTVARVEGRQLLGTGWVSRILQGLVLALWSDARTERRLSDAAATYAARRTALIEALARHGIVAHGRSGMNVWLPVPEEVATVRALFDAGWAISAGERFRIKSAPAVRITTARFAPAEAPALAAALAQTLAPAIHTRAV
jgi:DNA-binding transcriptional MocR family regulator